MSSGFEFEHFGRKKNVNVRRNLVKRLNDEVVVLSDKHGRGSVMVRECLREMKAGDLIQVKGIIITVTFYSILQSHSTSSGIHVIIKIISYLNKTVQKTHINYTKKKNGKIEIDNLRNF